MTAAQAIRRLGRIRRHEREMIATLRKPIPGAAQCEPWMVAGERQHRAQLEALNLAVEALRMVSGRTRRR